MAAPSKRSLSPSGEGLSPFTVVLLYPNDMQTEVDLTSTPQADHGTAQCVLTYTAHVKAVSRGEATKAAQKEAAFAQSPRRKMVHFRVVAIFDGHHKNHWF